MVVALGISILLLVIFGAILIRKEVDRFDDFESERLKIESEIRDWKRNMAEIDSQKTDNEIVIEFDESFEDAN